jgi:hypothetical protein
MANTPETTTPTPALVDQPNIKALLAPELPKLAAIEAEFCRLRSLLGEHSHEKTRADHKIATRALRDNPSTLTSQTLEQIEANFAARADEVGARRKLIKEALATFTKTTVTPAVLPLLKSAVVEGQKSQDRLEAAERDLYAPFAVAWTPSPLHRGLTLRLAEWKAKADQLERKGHVGYVSPSGLLTGIIDPADLHEAAKPKGGKR